MLFLGHIGSLDGRRLMVRRFHTDGEKVAAMIVFDMLPKPIRDKINNAPVPLPYPEYLNLFKYMEAGATVYDLDSYLDPVIAIQRTIIQEFVRKDIAKLKKTRLPQ